MADLDGDGMCRCGAVCDCGGDYTDPDGPYADDELCPTSHGHGCLDPECPCECHAEYG